jgi:Uma2 family endonuclease
MSENTTVKLMTSEEFFELPDDDGVDRWLINGELRTSEDRYMTKRNPHHCRATTNLAYLLESWARRQPRPRGSVYTADIYMRIRREPETNVGIDLAYAPPEVVAHVSKKTKFLDGPPVLAVEILSPGDKHEDVSEKIESFLEAGVKVVWIVDTDFQTVTIVRPDALPEMANIQQELIGDPHLPGFRVPVTELFVE